MAYKIFSEGKDTSWKHIYYKIEYETARSNEYVGVRYRISYSIDRGYWFGYNINAQVWTEGQNFGRLLKGNSPTSGGNTLLFPENGDYYWFNKGYTDNNINGCRIVINSTNGGSVPFDTGSDRTVEAPTGFLASTISSDVSFDIGNNINININDITNIGYTYTLWLDVVNDSNNWVNVTSLTTTSKNFTFNVSNNANTLYGLIKNRKSAKMRINLRTSYGNTTIGQTTKEGTVYVKNSEPQVPSIILDYPLSYVVGIPEGINTTSTIPTNNPSTVNVIINQSSLVAKNQSTLKKVIIDWINGSKTIALPSSITANISASINYINDAKLKSGLNNFTDTIKVTVVDSRGFSSSKTQTVQVIPYDLPSISSVSIRRKNMIDTKTYLTITGEVTLGIDWFSESSKDVQAKISTKKWTGLENTGIIYEQSIPTSSIVVDSYGYDANDPTTYTRRKFTITDFECTGDLGAQGFSTDNVFYLWTYAVGNSMDYTFLMQKVFDSYSGFQTVEKGKCLFDITPNGVSFGDLYNYSTGGALQINGEAFSGGGGGGDSFPIGAIVPFSSDTVPDNWLLCDADAISRTEYAELFSIIGTTFGPGDGSTTFNVPNLKGRTVVGKQPTDPDFKNVGQTGGSKFIQDHWHGYAYGSSAGGDGSGLVYSRTDGTQNKKTAIQGVQGTTTGNSGNLQPYFTVNFIIKAKMSASLKGQVIDSLNSSSTTDAPSIHEVKEALKANITTGQETMTNDYIDGKPVYVKRISFTMSSTLNSWQLIDTLSNFKALVNMYGSLDTGGESILIPTVQNSTEIIKTYIDSKSGKVNVWHTYSYVNGKSCYLNVYYLKS